MQATHELGFGDGTDSRAEAAHEELAHAPVLAEIARLALGKVDSEDERVEFVAGHAEPDGQRVRVDHAVKPRHGPERERAEDVNLCG